MDQEAMDLPPGFRFHPTDEELISHYLSPKAIDNTFFAIAIGEADLNKCEPWDLPKRAKMGEKEWYFFCVKDRKYPTGMRTNRATEAGYWKATGKDKEIFRGKTLVGMKKTLVFYKGRAPKGEKSNWIMHEYRLEGKTSLQKLPSTSKNEWVICRVFDKSGGAKKNPLMGLMSRNSYDNDLIPSGNLPPLMDSSPTQTKQGAPHVPCFSNPLHPLGPQTSQHYANEPLFDGFIINNNSFHSWHPADNFPRIQGLQSNSIFPPQASNYQENYPKQSMKTEGFNCNAEISSVFSNFYMGSRPFDDPDDPSTSGGPVDLDALLNY